MKSKFYLGLLGIFGLITISGFYLGKNLTKDLEKLQELQKEFDRVDKLYD
jgi:hypothetical protein